MLMFRYGMRIFYFFFSSRRRHTRCALVTGVQTCALPIPYSFSDQIGIASIHATLRPVAADLKRWLVDGVQGLGPDSPALLDLAAKHVSTVRLQVVKQFGEANASALTRSEEHTSELQSLMRISYAVFCLKKKKTQQNHNN